MTEAKGIYTLWLREVKRYLRDRIRIVSGIVSPLLWLLIFGNVVRFPVQSISLTSQQYLLPGIIGQTLLFTSMFVGISVIWDREFGFMKEVLVAPISRVSIFLGKMLGDSTDALIQGLIVIILGSILGITSNIIGFLAALPIMALITFGFVSLGLTIANFMNSLESFGTIQVFINLPLTFLSGALFPISGTGVPQLLQAASLFDPLTYGVDALRIVILGEAWNSLYPLYYDLLILCIFDIIIIALGTIALSRKR